MSTLADPRPGPRVGDLATRAVLTVAMSASLWDAWQLLLASGQRHVVVLNDGGGSVGILSDRNVLAEAPVTQEGLGRHHVADVMAQVPLVDVHPDDTPQHAADVMASNHVEAVPVLDDDGRLVGIVTESDIVRWVATTGT